MSFSPWSYTNSINDEEDPQQQQHLQQQQQKSHLQQQQYNQQSESEEEENDPSMPTEYTTPTTPTTAATKESQPTKPKLSVCSTTSTTCTDFSGGRPSDEYVRQMMIKTFTDEGRLANSFRILSFFPTFFEIYHITFTKIIKGNTGPLHRTWKTYIGLMVAAEQKCQYLFSAMKMDFLYNGGDPNWLRGLDHVPQKLRSISTLILKLARQPWRLNTDDVMGLLSGGVGGDAWSKGELVQATLVISTFLGLSSFILGCGITPEIDMTGGFYILPHVDSNAAAVAAATANGGIENELDLPCLLDQDAINASCAAAGWPQDDFAHFNTDHGIGLGVSTLKEEEYVINNEELHSTTEDLIHKLKSKKNAGVKEELLESLEKLKIQDGNKMKIDTKFNSRPMIDDSATANDAQNTIYDDLDSFVDPEANETILHEEFSLNHDEYIEFMLGEYCWEDHGCDLANHYMPGIGDDLVQEFTEAISITDWR